MAPTFSFEWNKGVFDLTWTLRRWTKSIFTSMLTQNTRSEGKAFIKTTTTTTTTTTKLTSLQQRVVVENIAVRKKLLSDFSVNRVCVRSFCACIRNNCKTGVLWHISYFYIAVKTFFPQTQQCRSGFCNEIPSSNNQKRFVVRNYIITEVSASLCVLFICDSWITFVFQ